MAQGPGYGSCDLISISQKSAGCPCPPASPGDVVKLGPHPNSVAHKSSDPVLPLGQFPTCHFSCDFLSLGMGCIVRYKPLSGSAINPLEKNVL